MTGVIAKTRGDATSLPMCERLAFLMVLLATAGRPVAGQDAQDVPAFVSGSARLVLRAGDRLQLGRLDACARPESQSAGLIDAVYPDSIVLQTSAGHLLLRAGSGDALAIGYVPVDGAPESSVQWASSSLVTGTVLSATGALMGLGTSVFLTRATQYAFSAAEFMITGAILGGFTGLIVGSDFGRVNEPTSTRLANRWGQLELRRDVRAATCEFRPTS